MISERLRATAGKGQGGPLKAEAADVIDALVAALDGVVAHYAKRTDFGSIVAADEQYPQIAKAMGALALARRK